MPEPWVSVDEVASRFSVEKDSVYQWIEGKNLPTYRVGRLWRFKLSENNWWVHAGGAGRDERGHDKGKG